MHFEIFHWAEHYHNCTLCIYNCTTETWGFFSFHYSFFRVISYIATVPRIDKCPGNCGVSVREALHWRNVLTERSQVDIYMLNWRWHLWYPGFERLAGGEDWGLHDLKLINPGKAHNICCCKVSCQSDKQVIWNCVVTGWQVRCHKMVKIQVNNVWSIP